MSNQSLYNDSIINCSSTPLPVIPSLDQLLDSLGFNPWVTIIASFVLPTISFLGIILCSLSAWIFFHKNFKDPVFFYYRLLCIVYIIHLIHNIPRGLLYSPRYFTNINTYLSSIYLIYYSNVSAFLFHFEETLKMAILLHQMKIYNSFVRKHFSAKPWQISLSLFLTCLLIDISYGLSLKVGSFGTYYYYDWSNGFRKNATFFYITSSEFSSTLFGKILLTFTGPFLNLFLSTFFGVILNFASVRLYKSYIKQRRENEEEYISASYHRTQDKNQATTSVDDIQVVVTRAKRLTQKELNENRTQSNMFYMALTQCSLSIIARVLLIFRFIVFFNFYSFSTSLILLIITLSIYTIVPTVAIFVFYSFNKMFREKFRKKFFSKENSKTNQEEMRN